MFTAISAVFLLLARPAAAQDTPKFEFAAGYQYMHDSKSSTDFPGAGCCRPAPTCPAGSPSSARSPAAPRRSRASGSTDLNVGLYTFLGGPRVTASSKAPVAPFVQILFGAAHGTLSVGTPSSSLSVSGTHFAVQPGAGIDFNPSPRFGIRVEADGRGIKGDTDTVGQWRIVGAVVFRK